jgi:CRISPR-associated endonuclease/helicase Cas3
MASAAVSTGWFPEAFAALTGHPPFPWQRKLFERFIAADWPSAVSLPTGTGKTSIMAIWLLGLAKMAETTEAPIGVPRRLVWVVNRRVVVDQATSEAERLRARIADETVGELTSVRLALTGLAAVPSNEVLAISTLRGQFADNAEWRNDPARPSIVIGTVDMIGSRILFSGYGLGFRSKPLHAGFLAQDSLIIHDEAHLEPAFQALISSVQSEQRLRGDFRPLCVMPLTATSRDGTGDGEFSLGDKDRTDERLQSRIRASKAIAFHPVTDENAVAGEVLLRALDFKDSGKAILVFLRKLKDLETVAKGLEKVTDNVRRLTGTLRGLERDTLARDPTVFARFLPGATSPPDGGTVYLVCTSAGEVGVNISADHMVCDLAPFDSMAQRLGRVNRFGEGAALVDVIHPDDGTPEGGDAKDPERPLKLACRNTLEILRGLPLTENNRHDGSPATLEALLGSISTEQRESAFTPPPAILPATDILFDAWALTSVREKMPGRPPVADWLHGISGWQPAETYVAWREEVEVVTSELQDRYAAEDLLEDYPLKPHELLRDTSERIAKELLAIAERVPEKNVWILMPDGNVQTRFTIAELSAALKKKEFNLKDCTVLLPPCVGALRKGMLVGAEPFKPDQGDSYDISDRLIDEGGKARRCRLWDNEEAPPRMRLVRSIDVRPSENNEDEEEGAAEAQARGRWNWYVLPANSDDDASITAPGPQELHSHVNLAMEFAGRLARKLIGEPDEASAVVLAVKWHDLGKRRSTWQRSIGNNDSNLVLAKSGGTRMVEITGYRHEFGSVLDIETDPEFQAKAPRVRELVLHLVAAHHGRARPYFPAKEAFDHEHTDEAAAKAARAITRRYGLLQRRYGRWGLAYLESLVRSADALASQSYGTEPSALEASL